MKRIFTAIAIAGLALIATVPAQATTFPGLTLIYVASGAVDADGSGSVGTSVPCSNQSGTTATVRWRFFNETGQEIGILTSSLLNGQTLAAATDNGTFVWIGTPTLANSFMGKVVIYSTQSGVFCSAVVADASNFDAGSNLHMVRFNAHPGTVE